MAPPSGQFGTLTDLQNKWGINTLAAWADLNNTMPAPVADPVRIQAAFDYADAFIIDFFREYGNYATPIVANDIYTANLLKDWEAVVAGDWLYNSRRIRNAETNQEGWVSTGIRKAKSEMLLHCGVKHLNAARRWPTATGPVGV